VATKWPTTLARKGCPFLDLPSKIRRQHVLKIRLSDVECAPVRADMAAVGILPICRANRAQWPATVRLHCWPGDTARTVTAQIQAAADYRTLSAQPHKPAQLFLPMPASRRKIAVDIRGEALYKG